VCVFGHLPIPPVFCGRSRRRPQWTTEGSIAPGPVRGIARFG
jgi:hypothetical protein